MGAVTLARRGLLRSRHGPVGALQACLACAALSRILAVIAFTVPSFSWIGPQIGRKSQTPAGRLSRVEVRAYDANVPLRETQVDEVEMLRAELERSKRELAKEQKKTNVLRLEKEQLQEELARKAQTVGLPRDPPSRDKNDMQAVANESSWQLLAKWSDKRMSRALEKFWRRLSGKGDPDDEVRVLRQNVVTGRWTLYVAGGSAQKPQQYSQEKRLFPKAEDQPAHDPRCPFCVGNEHKTPNALLSVDAEGAMWEGPILPEGWRVRVMPNIFPLLVTPPGAYDQAFRKRLERLPHSAAAEGKQCYDCVGPLADAAHPQMDAIGYSEVVVEDSRHNGLLGIVDAEQVSLSLKAMQARGRVLAKKPDTKFLIYFKQYGPFSGGSLVHPHMQLMAIPVITPEMQNQLYWAQEFHKQYQTCLKCTVLRDEPLGDGPASSRLVHESKHFLAVVPFAGRDAHVSIVPRAHRHSWLEIDQEELYDLAWILQLVMEGLYYLLDDPSYILNIHSWDSDADADGELERIKETFHWGLEIQPRFAADVGGVEVASGVRVVDGLPEEFAQKLRGMVEERLVVKRGSYTDSP